MKGQIKIKQDIRNNKAITLIALVVTIVVLLILAGVSISMLAGENGIITQVQEAKEKTRQAEIEEKVKLAVMAAKTEGLGSIDIDKFNEELKNNGYTGGKITELPAEVIIDGVKIEIKEDGSTEIKGTTIGGEVPNTLAGLRDSEQPVEGNKTLEDENGDKITIPDGFNVDKDSPIKVVEGIVIEDSYDNEYVWIPVFEKSNDRTWGADYVTAGVTTAKTAERTSFTTADYTAIQTALKAYTATYADSEFSDEWYGDENYGLYGYYDGTKFNYYTNGNMTESEYNELYQNMLVSVYKNGGFYIGRYEMGIGVATSVETADSLTRTTMTEYTASFATNTSTTVVENGAPSIEGMSIPVSKVDAVPYIYITQSQAQMLAKKMSETYQYGTTTSSLMFGVQWDAVCVFLEKYGKLSDGTPFDSSYLTDNEYSKLWGNYYNATFTMNRGYYNVYNIYAPTGGDGWKEKTEKISTRQYEGWLCTTGASKQNSALNIYDFGGNLVEYTLEWHSYSYYPVTVRGGTSYNAPCAFERGDMILTCGSGYADSARPSLFL